MIHAMLCVKNCPDFTQLLPRLIGNTNLLLLSSYYLYVFLFLYEYRKRDVPDFAHPSSNPDLITPIET